LTFVMPFATRRSVASSCGLSGASRLLAMVMSPLSGANYLTLDRR
jgi:hypothetical protein